MFRFALASVATLVLVGAIPSYATARPSVRQRQKAALKVLRAKKIGGITVVADRKAFRNRAVSPKKGLFRRYRISGRKEDLHRLEALARQTKQVHKLVERWTESRGGKPTAQLDRVTIVPRSVSKGLIKKVGQEVLIGVEAGLISGRLAVTDRYRLATHWDDGKMFPLFDPFFPKVSTTRKYWSFLNPFGTVRTTAVAAIAAFRGRLNPKVFASESTSSQASESEMRVELESQILAGNGRQSPRTKRLLSFIARAKKAELQRVIGRFQRQLASSENQEKAFSTVREAAYRSNWKFNFRGFKGLVLMNLHRVFVGSDGQAQADPIDTVIDVENGRGIYMGFFDDVRVSVDTDALTGRVVDALRSIALEAAFLGEDVDK